MSGNLSLSKKELTAAFETLGCRLNIAETGRIAKDFEGSGYKIVSFGVAADVTVINTCTVTNSADVTCRNLIRKALKFSPRGRIVVVGCYAQLKAEKISSMDGVDLVLGTDQKFEILKHLDFLDSSNDKLDNENRIAIRRNIERSRDFQHAFTTTADKYHTRAFLKIQDGCDYFCSYCIIPFARGRSKSISLEQAVNDMEELVNKGFKEVVLTGVNIGEYRGPNNERLAELTEALLVIPGLKRLRFSSLELNTICDDLIKILVSSEKFMDHFHLPLQSGDDDILRSMNRKYTVSQYRDMVIKLKKIFPDATFGADVIVGYPDETESKFQNTKRLLSELPITHFHIFPYSVRDNTRASRLPDEIPSTVKKQRVKDLMELGKDKMQKITESFVGRENRVLFEKIDKEEFFEGYTTNFLRVKYKNRNRQNLKNQILKVKLDKAFNGKLYVN